MKQSAIYTEIVARQLKLRRLRQDYESALLNEVPFDNIKIIQQAVKRAEDELALLLSEIRLEPDGPGYT